MRWRWSRRGGETSPADYAWFAVQLARLALPSAVDVKLRRLRRRLGATELPDGAREWLEWCEGR